MLVEPAAGAFARAYEAGEPQVVWTRLVADLETPVSAMLKLAQGRPNSFLLESVEGGATRGRYSIIGIEPDLLFRAFGARAEVAIDPQRGAQRRLSRRPPNRRWTPSAASSPNPVSACRRTCRRWRPGIFGYLGYDVVRLMERLPTEKPDPLALPDAVLMRPTAIVVFDTVKDEITIVTPVRPKRGPSAEQAHARAVDRLRRVVDALDAPLDNSAEMSDRSTPTSR